MKNHPILALTLRLAAGLVIILVSVFQVFAAAPANDDRTSPTAISSLPFNETIQTNEATAATDDPWACGYGPAATVWYSFTPASDLLLQLSTAGSSYNTLLAVFDSTGGLFEVSCAANQPNLTTYLTGGVTYLIMVGSTGSGYPYPGPGPSGGTLVLAASELQPPPNDLIANAIDASPLPFSDTQDISGASYASDDPQPNCDNYGPVKTIWYKFTPDHNVYIEASVSSSWWNVSLNVYHITPASFENIKCSGYPVWPVTVKVSDGYTYFFMINAASDVNGELTFALSEVTPPANNDFASAWIIQALPFSDYQDNSVSDTEPGEPTPTCVQSHQGSLSNTLWFAYTPAVNGPVTGFIESAYSIFLAVYRGSDLNNLVELGCNISLGRVTANMEAGQTYYYQIGSMAGVTDWFKLHLEVAPLPVAQFWYSPYQPVANDFIAFYNSSYDPGDSQISSTLWNFGDGNTSTDWDPSHQYTADGDYTVTLTVTTTDGRTASRTHIVSVRTHDVAITKFTVPQSARAGQTRSIVVSLNNRRYPETVTVDFYRSSPNGFVWAGQLTQHVPVRPSNRTTDFNFSYTFTPEDASYGKVTFKAVATIVDARDFLPADNEAISLPTKVTR